MQKVKWWAWVMCILFLFSVAGCSAKKEGDACERDSQCEGLLACYKDPPDAEEGKCIKAKQARALYNKRKKEKNK